MDQSDALTYRKLMDTSVHHWRITLKNGSEFAIDAVTMELFTNGDALFRDENGLPCGAVSDWLIITEAINA